MSEARQGLKTCELKGCDNLLPPLRPKYCSDQCCKDADNLRRVRKVERKCHCGNEIKPPRRVVCSAHCLNTRDLKAKAANLLKKDPEAAWRKLLAGTGHEDCEKAIEADRTGRAPLPKPAFVAREATS